MRTVTVKARARGSAWEGVLRGWIEQRGRALRDRPGVEAVRIRETPMGLYRWELQLDLSSVDARADTALRELVADLDLLEADPVIAGDDGSA